MFPLLYPQERLCCKRLGYIYVSNISYKYSAKILLNKVTSMASEVFLMLLLSCDCFVVGICVHTDDKTIIKQVTAVGDEFYII